MAGDVPPETIGPWPKGAYSLYQMSCRGCHGNSANVNVGTIPALNQAHRYLGVKGGRPYLIRAPGVANSPLTDRQTAAVLNWVLKHKTPVNNFIPFTTEEVAKHRQASNNALAERAKLNARMAALEDWQ
ncbi:cytochrome c family protein [Modicisalibacter luteus]|uniref:Cytochrome c domain-containing protein n=1 Tax=Modicisalibacter luteus TaxID=453962 RepID=A0ABV7M5R3_9GAMM|nr:hypothetical protein [Halomonas lutea]